MSFWGRFSKGQKEYMEGEIKMPNWTKEQKQAIYEKNSNLLVAAAAGSRKDSCASRKNYKQSNK